MKKDNESTANVNNGFATDPPKTTQDVLVSFPKPHVMLLTMNRPHRMNALSYEASWEMHKVLEWFDNEPDMRVAIVTGAGKKAFNTGMDLKERLELNGTGVMPDFPPNGFADLTHRHGRKPIIAAVNGYAHGGGMEIAVNADLVIASTNATFKLPDVERGTIAMLGCLPRLSLIFGRQRAMQIALAAYNLTAMEAKEWGLVMKVVEQDKLLEEAIQTANHIAKMSPDSIIATRHGVLQAWEQGSANDAMLATQRKYSERFFTGENFFEGIKAFSEKRKPVWKPSKL